MVVFLSYFVLMLTIVVFYCESNSLDRPIVYLVGIS